MVLRCPRVGGFCILSRDLIIQPSFRLMPHWVRPGIKPATSWIHFHSTTVRTPSNLLIRRQIREFPGGLVGKDSYCHCCGSGYCYGSGLIPSPGTSACHGTARTNTHKKETNRKQPMGKDPAYFCGGSNPFRVRHEAPPPYTLETPWLSWPVLGL